MSLGYRNKLIRKNRIGSWVYWTGANEEAGVVSASYMWKGMSGHGRNVKVVVKRPPFAIMNDVHGNPRASLQAGLLTATSTEASTLALNCRNVLISFPSLTVIVVRVVRSSSFSAGKCSR